MLPADTTLLHLLDAPPELVEELARHHAHFAQLRDATTRRLVAPRVTVAQAAAMAGGPPGGALGAPRRAAGGPGGRPAPPRRPPATRSLRRPPRVPTRRGCTSTCARTPGEAPSHSRGSWRP